MRRDLSRLPPRRGALLSQRRRRHRDHLLRRREVGVTTRNPARKLFDWTLTLPALVLKGRERILELYLNNVEWAPGVFGIDAAARYDYGVSARNFTRRSPPTRTSALALVRFTS